MFTGRKADDAFTYMIHRVLPDGKREFVGATPSDALYLGKLERIGDEEAATFEITPYTENGCGGFRNLLLHCMEGCAGRLL